MTDYELIFEALQEKVDNGQLTVEQAELVNDLAYNKYITEKKTTAEYRKEKFLKKYNYDPKTKTIESNGRRVQFNYVNDTKKKNSIPYASASLKDNSYQGDYGKKE